MDKKLRETTYLCGEIMNSKRQVKGKNWSRGTNSRLPFDVNVMLKVIPWFCTAHLLLRITRWPP